jgi:hypothetical protein
MSLSTWSHYLIKIVTVARKCHARGTFVFVSVNTTCCDVQFSLLGASVLQSV